MLVRSKAEAKRLRAKYYRLMRVHSKRSHLTRGRGDEPKSPMNTEARKRLEGISKQSGQALA